MSKLPSVIRRGVGVAGFIGLNALALEACQPHRRVNFDLPDHYENNVIHGYADCLLVRPLAYGWEEKVRWQHIDFEWLAHSDDLAVAARRLETKYQHYFPKETTILLDCKEVVRRFPLDK